jgi:hypothetical protein
MITGVSIERSAYGLRAVLASAWSEAIGRYLQEKAVAEIELNHAKGWHGDTLSFLSAFPQLRSPQPKVKLRNPLFGFFLCQNGFVRIVSEEKGVK